VIAEDATFLEAVEGFQVVGSKHREAYLENDIDYWLSKKAKKTTSKISRRHRD